MVKFFSPYIYKFGILCSIFVKCICYNKFGIFIQIQ